MLLSISQNIFSNMEAPIVFLIVAIVLRIANIILGSIDAMFKKDFDWGKFFSGIWKMLVVALVILMVIIILNLFAYGLTLIDVVLPQSTFSAMECILIVVTWCVDLAMEVKDKIQGLKTLKYIKYDDIQLQENAQTQQEIG